MKKTLSVFLALVMGASLLAGCGSKTAGSPERSEGVESAAADSNRQSKVSAVVIALDSLDPYLVQGAITPGYLIYEPLWTMNETNDEMLGVIAKDWTIDGKNIDVTIYDYIEDSAGNHITAADVVWSYEAYKKAGKQSNAKYLAAMKQTGDYSLRIEMTVEPWPTLLSTIRVPIISQAAYEAPDADFVAHPVGTGHYAVKEFVASNKAVYEKRDSHWQSDVDESLVPFNYKANADVVELACILETPQIQNGLETGNIQCGAVTATIVEEMEGNPEISFTTRPGKYTHELMLNCYQGILADNLALRKAILYAIDTDAIAQAVTKGTGHGSVTVGDESLAGFLDAFNGMDYYGYDLEKAKEYMAEAGYPDGGITLKWLGKTEEAVQLTAQVIQAQLAEIGITLEISNLDNTTYMAQRPAYEGDWNLCWGDTVPKGNYVLAYQTMIDNTLYEKGNAVGLKDPKMQEVFMTALYDQSEENILALHEYVRDSACLIGLYVDFDFWGHDKNLTVVTGNDGEVAPNAFILNDNYDVYAD